MSLFISETRPEATADQERTQVAIYGSPISHSVAPKLFDHIFPAIGLPRFKYGIRDCKSMEDPHATWHVDMKLPSTLGSCVTMPCKVSVIPFCEDLTPQAKAIGSVNTTFFRQEGSKSVLVGTNLDQAGVGNSLLTVLTGHPTPFPPNTPTTFQAETASALMIGGGGATRAAIYAMHSMGLSPIFLVNRDSAETKAIVDQFSEYDLRPLESIKAVKEAIEEGKKTGVKLCASVGAIPSIEPKTEAEKLVFEIVKLIFSQPYDATSIVAPPRGFMSLPKKPVHLEMAYKPRMTLIRQIAEERDWQTICGVEVVLEGCFEQCYLWTGKVVPLDVREGGRRILRAE